jgi:hypothetical protein
MKRVILLLSLFLLGSTTNFCWSQEKSDFIISTRIGLNTLKEQNIYFSYFLTDTLGLQLSVARITRLDWDGGILCGALPLRIYNERRGFAIKAGVTFRRRMSYSFLLNYRREQFGTFSYHANCFGGGNEGDSRLYDHWKGHEIGMICYVDTGERFKWINFYFGYGMGARFVDEAYQNRRSSVPYVARKKTVFVPRFDLGFRLNLRI